MAITPRPISISITLSTGSPTLEPAVLQTIPGIDLQAGASECVASPTVSNFRFCRTSFDIIAFQQVSLHGSSRLYLRMS
jgi:hypothetical protein